MFQPRLIWSWLLLAGALGSCTPSKSQDTSKSSNSASDSRLQVAGESGGEVDSLCGWEVKQNQVTLTGIATGMDFAGGDFGDGDWSLFVRPDPDYEYLLVNSSGWRNQDGLIECEVEPPYRVWASGQYVYLF